MNAPAKMPRNPKLVLAGSIELSPAPGMRDAVAKELGLDAGTDVIVYHRSRELLSPDGHLVRRHSKRRGQPDRAEHKIFLQVQLETAHGAPMGYVELQPAACHGI